MTEPSPLSRPNRDLDRAFGVAGVLLGIAAIVLDVIGVAIGPGFFYLAGLGVLLGTSTAAVSFGIERFTGDALREGDIDEDTGWLIGKLENVIVLILVLVGAWIALSIVFAAKSIVRREDISSGNTTYYLAGTLLNFTYTIVVGLATRWLIGFLGIS